MRCSCSLITLFLLASTDSALAQVAESSPPSESAHEEPTVPLARILEALARKTGKKFVVDTRVRPAVVLIGQSPESVTYNDLLTILHASGDTAIESGGYVSVIPDANVRYLAPLITERDTRPDAQYVTLVIPVKTVSAVQLVPILRPLVPNQGSIVALPATNTLILVDTYSNVKRLEGVVRSIDVGEPYRPGKTEPSAPQHE
jgi:type II secretory pathway component GspD/PulD (secretin)